MDESQHSDPPLGHCPVGRGPLVSPRVADGCTARVIREPVRATPTSPAALLLPWGIGLLLRARNNGRTTRTRSCPGTIADITAASLCRLCLCHAPSSGCRQLLTPGAVVRSPQRGVDGVAGGALARSRGSFYRSRPALACIVGARRACTVEMISSEEIPCDPCATASSRRSSQPALLGA
jgi:hypothetical protein